MIYAYTRIRYQVSVYRTIGPLVFICKYGKDQIKNSPRKDGNTVN